MIDLGQCEGGIVQGLGWMTMEEIIYDEEGRLRSNALSTYKVPDIYSVPKEIDIHFLHTQNDNLAIFLIVVFDRGHYRRLDRRVYCGLETRHQPTAVRQEYRCFPFENGRLRMQGDRTDSSVGTR